MYTVYRSCSHHYLITHSLNFPCVSKSAFFCLFQDVILQPPLTGICTPKKEEKFPFPTPSSQPVSSMEAQLAEVRDTHITSVIPTLSSQSVPSMEAQLLKVRDTRMTTPSSQPVSFMDAQLAEVRDTHVTCYCHIILTNLYRLWRLNL